MSTEVNQLLNDGGKLLHYAERIIRNKNPKLWRSFERVCLTQSLIRIEALYESLTMLPDYIECKKSMERQGRTYSIADHLRRCISDWIYYKGLTADESNWNPMKQFLVYWTKDGKINAICKEDIYPRCHKCGKELSLDVDGHLHCCECDCDTY